MLEIYSSKEISGAEARNIFERAQSRLMHLFQRLDRVPVEGQTSELVDELNLLSGFCRLWTS